MKNKIGKLFGILLILLGVLFIFNKTFLNMKIEKDINSMNDYIDRLNPEDLSKNMGNKTEFNYDDVDNISPSKTFRKINEEDKKYIIGQLTIPSINVNVVVFNGLNEDKLLKGISTMKPNQIMGEGNYALAGHYGIKNELFANLDKMQKGDLIYLTDKQTIYIYEMYEKEVVSPEKTSMIEDYHSDSREKPIISLMSCYYVNGKNTGDRIFIKGELVNTKEYSKEFMEHRD